MTDYNTMTTQQCSDWLAERDGWNHEPPQVDGMGETREYWWKWTISSAHGGRTYSYKHPFPLTLDAAAAALREPWQWDEILWYTTTVYVQIRNVKTHERTGFEYFDELTARYRAAVAARMEDDK